MTRSPNAVVGCQKIGAIETSSFYPPTPEGLFLSGSSSETKLKNKAASLGDTLLILETDKGLISAKSKGIVYKCLM